MGQEEQGTGAPKETAMELDQQDGLGNEARTDAVQELPVGLPPLERRRQLDIVSAVAQISLLAQALGGIPTSRGGPQMGLSEGRQRHEQQTAQQEEGDGQASRQAGSERSAP